MECGKGGRKGETQNISEEECLWIQGSVSSQASVTPPMLCTIPIQNGVESVSSYARLQRYAQCSLDACRTHLQRERERGGKRKREWGAGYPAETECPGLDVEVLLGVTAARSGVVACRVAISCLNSPSCGGNGKTL